MVARIVAPDKDARGTPDPASSGIAPTGFVAEPIGINEVDPRRAGPRCTRSRLVVGSTATVIIWTIAVIMVLGELGVDLAPLIAGAGIAGVALGFGAQSLVKDCIAGLFMLLEDQYGIGDIVDLDEASRGGREDLAAHHRAARRRRHRVARPQRRGAAGRATSRSCWSVALVDVDVAYDCDLAAARAGDPRRCDRESCDERRVV